MKIKSDRMYESIGLFVYKICLDLVYVFFICDEYGYRLTNKVDFEALHYFESWMLLFLLIFLRPKKKSITSYYLLMQLCVTIIPMLTVYGLSCRARFFIYLICAVHCLQCILEKVINIKTNEIFTIKQGEIVNNEIIAVITGATLLFTLKEYGLPSFSALNFNNVYSIRAEKSLFGIMSYIGLWFFTVVLPMMIVLSLSKRKKWTLALFCLIALFLYLTYAHKSWLFSALFVVAMYYIVKKAWYTKALCVGLPLMVSICMVAYEICDKLQMLPSLFVRRILFLPADIEFAYFNFFEHRQKLHFSEGLIGKLFHIDSVYDERIVYIIGKEMGTPGSACNTGYLADAYANAGTVGVVIFALFLFSVLKFMDIVLRKEDFAINFCVLSFALYGLNDSALLTRLMNGGLALLILMLVLGKNANKSTNKLETKLRIKI